MPSELAPELPAVAPDPGVEEFMEEDEVAEVLRQNGQTGVELDAA
jgi:hypothetical protein